MTDKMLLHSAGPFLALTEMDVTVVALPGGDDAATQELTARHGLRFPGRHGADASAIADAAAAGCDIAVVTTQPGSKSQQNMQRQGFDLLYTRAILLKQP